MREDMEVPLSQTKMAVVLGRWVGDNEADTIFAKRFLMPVGGDGGARSVGSIGGCQNALLEPRKTLYSAKNGKSMLDLREWDVAEEKLSA